MSEKFCVKIAGKEFEASESALLKDVLKPIIDKGIAIAVKCDGKTLGLNTPVTCDMDLVPVNFASNEGEEIYWHTTSHVMAQAVKRLFPDVKLAIGPSIKKGFYYDFGSCKAFTPEDLKNIEKEMQSIIDADIPISGSEMSRQEALDFFDKDNEIYKKELIADIDESEDISFFTQGEFTDLCRGPHLASTGSIKAFKLLSLAGAYWRGDEKGPMLQRIYGISFAKEKELRVYLKHLEEVKKRDHRRLGTDLGLFSMSDNIGPGLTLWHPKGAFIRHKIEEFWKEKHLLSGYELLYTPHIAKLGLWETSGHVDFYRENMFSGMDVDGMEYQLKPMNCPFHIQVYKAQKKSYRELPVRWAELGTVYRYERSGVLHGLMRVRGFTQDDAHIFCTVDQVKEEIAKALKLTEFFLTIFGFTEYEVYLSTRPEKYVGSLDNWDVATNALKDALVENDFAYEVDPGEGVFYGPKIDIKIKDSLGRVWQCSTIQVDFNLPERFDLSYVASDGSLKKPIMIHRALLGSLERFFGILIEHYNGAFPVWLSSTQVVVMPITDDHHEYAGKIDEMLKAAGIRSKIDARSEKVGMKIREAQLNKVPYMLVLGQKEVDDAVISVRKRNGEVSYGVDPEQFIADIRVDITEKK